MIFLVHANRQNIETDNNFFKKAATIKMRAKDKIYYQKVKNTCKLPCNA